MYFGMSELHLSMDEYWLMPFSLLLDLRECYRQTQGLANPRREVSIDDLIPTGI